MKEGEDFARLAGRFLRGLAAGSALRAVMKAQADMARTWADMRTQAANLPASTPFALIRETNLIAASALTKVALAALPQADRVEVLEKLLADARLFAAEAPPAVM